MSLRLLGDDRVDGERRLADRPIADDQLALAAPQREQRVEDQHAGLHRLGDQLAFEDAGRRALDRLPPRRGDRSAAVDRPAERIDDAAEQRLADRDAHDVAGSAHSVARFDRLGLVEQDATDAVALERLGEAELSAVETHQLVEPDVGQAGNQRDAVLDLFDPADRLDLRAEFGAIEPRPRAVEPALRQTFDVIRHRRSPSSSGRGRRANCWRR